MTYFGSTVVTILSGVFVFVIGQVVLEMLIKPYQEYKSIKAEISYLLAYYGNIFTNPLHTKYTDKLDKEDIYFTGSDEFRKAAAKLEGFIQCKPFFLRKKNLRIVFSEMIGLSNGFFSDQPFKQLKWNDKSEQTIKDGLNLK